MAKAPSSTPSPKFSVGDQVELKSGGPVMTVEKVQINAHDQFTGTYRCQWFAGKKLDGGLFPENSLVSSTPKSSAQTTKP